MDLQLVRACLRRKDYDVLIHKIPYDLVGQTTTALIRWIGAYYKSNPEAGGLTPEYLKAYIQVRLQHQLEDAGTEVLMKLCDKLQNEPDPELPTLFNMLMEQDFVGKVGSLYVRYEQGDEVDFYTEVEQLTKDYNSLRRLRDIPEYDITEVLDSIRYGKAMKLT